ncbi:zona pellucida-like domain containing protein 10 [Dermatophagoides farinae]|uniref:Zona pellucida-like domain containing protein 10 n=1 Tax=Dermatophagoides farinae TaxID=6954 RepID=A0A9D4P195_DERFA|nr:zona pellucida-like domain containing protein 10 [Dermatophagoides farinae]
MEPYEQQQQQKQKPFHSCGHHRRSSSNKMLKSNHRFEMPNYHHDHHQNDEYGRRKLPIFSVSDKVTSLMTNSKLSNSNPLGNHNINIGKAVFDQRSNEIPSSSAAGTPAVSIKPDLFGLITEVNVECNSNAIHIALIAPHLFNGMIYPKGLSKNSSCMHEYYDVNEFNYTLPLRACNTMSMDVDDGIEYFNTVIVQPHRRLVTNQGRGYHIRCRYQTKDKRITNGYNLTLSQEGKTETTPLYGTAPVPTSSMKIYHQGTQKEIIADNVKIGDRLTLTIAIEQQDIYGMKITNCLVRDGLNWGEQPLINDEGCPVDKEIMGPFDYSLNLTRASVSFHAHKFPYTSSVYYQCNVRLCLKDEIDGCTDVPPSCDQNGRNYRHLPGHQRRQRRDTYDAVVIPDMNHQQYHRAMAQRMRNTKMDKDLSMEVYSGLYVDENENNTPELDDEESETSMNGDNDQDRRHGRNHHNRHHDPNEFCISMRKFAIGVAIASLLLMLAVLLLVICILQRRRRRHHQQHQRFYSQSAAGSTIGSGSVYSGPYTNRGYIRD